MKTTNISDIHSPAGKRLAIIDGIYAFVARLVCGGDFYGAQDIGFGEACY